jgi:hypothetical protein
LELLDDGSERVMSEPVRVYSPDTGLITDGHLGSAHPRVSFDLNCPDSYRFKCGVGVGMEPRQFGDWAGGTDFTKHICGSRDPYHRCCGYEPQGCCGSK